MTARSASRNARTAQHPARESQATQAAAGELTGDWTKATLLPVQILTDYGSRWTAACFEYFMQVACAPTPEERLKAQERCLRTLSAMSVDCTCALSEAAFKSVNQTALDLARTMEVEAVTPAAVEM